MLYSVGFQHAKELSRKTVSLFQLCKQLLSPQQHYDWGLRALKSILGVAGLLILVSSVRPCLLLLTLAVAHRRRSGEPVGRSRRRLSVC